ncbi:MAG: hypothetical protein PHE15_00765 [Dehalococcoidales bacterium]|jgi:hypothetical protein|nr:hypothetical protein [Dehalococcoidales bacterium]
MKIKTKLLYYLLLGVTLPLITPIYGCSEPAYHGQAIPEYITFENHLYKNNGETIAKEKAPQNVTFIGRAFLEGQTISEMPTTYEGYQVYSIQGVDSDLAIAIKFFLVSEKDAYYFYFKYVRQD